LQLIIYIRCSIADTFKENTTAFSFLFLFFTWATPPTLVKKHGIHWMQPDGPKLESLVNLDIQFIFN
jgi:hypothetical protein